MITEHWRNVAALRRQTLLNKIPTQWRLSKNWTEPITIDTKISVTSVPGKCGILNPRELEITENYDATSLLETVAFGQFSSFEVTLAFCKRAAIAHQLTCCLTEIFFDEALERAKYLDEYLARTGKTLGPLHGLPVSLKDLFKIKGIDATIGFIANVDKPPSSENSPLVDILLARGAILYVKTNIPQTMMSLDSDNNVFGRTLNPHNSLVTPGGSSGGEGALIALRGSILGIGTDVAGSIRVPALCSGTYGYMPTASRIPLGGIQMVKRPGLPGIQSAAGPLATSARDLHLFLKAILKDDIWAIDESAFHLPWRNVASPKKALRIGVIVESDHQPIHPPILRSITAAQSLLSKAGHTLILLHESGSLIHPSAVIAWKAIFVDPNPLAFELIKRGNEPVIKSLANRTQKLGELSAFEPSLESLFTVNIQRSQMQKSFKDLFSDHNLDTILLPGNQSVAPPHDSYGVPEYTVLANLLNFPATVIPFLHANEELDRPFKRNVEYKLPYIAENIEDLPSHIQLIGKPLQDEEFIEIVKSIDVILRKG